MIKKLIWTGSIGGVNVNVFVTPEWGGYFTNNPAEKALPEICIGLGSNKWDSVVTALIHELHESEMFKAGVRYDRCNDFGNDHAGYTFFMSHNQFSDVCSRVSGAMVQILPVLAKEFEINKKKNNPK